MRLGIRTLGRKFLKTAKRYQAKAAAPFTRPNVFRLGSSERVGIIYNNPSEMSIPERMFLYALVRGIRPKRVLEIGSRHGGSASIIAAAMMDINPAESTKIVGVDPGPEITVPDRKFFGKFKLVIQPSPEGITDARKEVDAPFDFVLIDGLHIYTQVKKDLEGALPHLADNTYILLHDAFHLGISKAVEEVCEANPNVIDCGYPCGKPSMQTGSPLAYGGFRMLLFRKGRVTDPQPLLQAEAKSLGLPPKSDDPDLADHDPYWYCKKFKRCAYCVKNGLNPTTPPAV